MQNYEAAKGESVKEDHCTANYELTYATMLAR